MSPSPISSLTYQTLSALNYFYTEASWRSPGGTLLALTKGIKNARRMKLYLIEVTSCCTFCFLYTMHHNYAGKRERWNNRWLTFNNL